MSKQLGFSAAISVAACALVALASSLGDLDFDVPHHLASNPFPIGIVVIQ